MTYNELKKILLVTSVSGIAAFGLSACGDDKAAAPAAMEKAVDDSAAETSSAMGNAKEVADEMVEEAKEKAAEVVEKVKEKAAEVVDDAKEDAMDEAKKRAEEEIKNRMPQ
ncbi:MAG: hypothetical protein JKY45_05325 [Emcibacter sp.]|nr:hypothetical protein [Emcibacter sp.]